LSFPVPDGLRFETILHRESSSEEEFENALGQILSSQEVKQVISALLAQIHADMPKQ
jgi:hypothetical protein